MNSQPVKLLDRVRVKIRLKHYSIRTIQELPGTCIRKFGHINYLINRKNAPVPSAVATGQAKCVKKSFFICFPLTPEE